VWSRKLKKFGKESLAMQKATGRPPSLTETDKAELEQILKAGAVAAGFESERWTQERVQQVIEQKFRVQYHRNYISRLLHDLGWSVQKPETRALERDEELIRAWLSKDWARIKKSAAARRRDHLRR
jgi:transposase